ncbi:MAG: LamG-like jellyroll fold domain-containing protein, partial [Thermoguttaceae bacterium]
GVEADSPDGKVIRWSQPEIALYDDDPFIRMSYPDLVEEEGEYYLTETQKDKARVHKVDRALLEGLWSQATSNQVTRVGLLAEWPAEDGAAGSTIKLPALPTFVDRDNGRADYGTKDLRRGFTIEAWVRLKSLEAGQVLLDNRNPAGQGFALQTTPRGTLELVLNDGRTENHWDCDPGLLEADKLHHVVATVDGGPKIIAFVVDGALCDGGDFRQFGWGRFNPNYRGPQGDNELRIGPAVEGQVLGIRLYGRALRTSEAIGNFHHGCPGAEGEK